MTHRPIRAALVLALAAGLAACGKQPASQQDLDSLDRELAATNTPAHDPAITASLADQIMVDPALTQSANADAIRPPSRPDSGAVPVDLPPRADGVDPKSLKSAPPASGNCPECEAAKGALTLGALAGASRADADCAARIGYSATWSNRLPAALPLYPDARITEAAGTDANGCSLRIVSFASGAPVQRVLDWYFTKASAAGYSAGHRTDGTQHVLGGTKAAAGYLLYVTPKGTGSSVDLVANGGV